MQTLYVGSMFSVNVSAGLTQSKMSKLDSIYLTKKKVVEPSISKGTSTYKMPISPEGYSIQLIGYFPK